MKICPVGAALFQADGRTDGHYEAKSSFFSNISITPKERNVSFSFPFCIHNSALRLVTPLFTDDFSFSFLF